MKTICIHHNDLDGRCSAAILQAAINTPVEMWETDYSKAPPPIEPGDIVWILDFSYKPDVMRSIVETADTVVWIDHRDYSHV